MFSLETIYIIIKGLILEGVKIIKGNSSDVSNINFYFTIHKT